MRPFLPLLIAAFLGASFVAAQTSIKPNHVHTQSAATAAPLTGTNVPDIIAERLVLINLGRAYAQNAKPDDLAAQRAFISSIGLSVPEMASLKQIAENFAATWDARIEQQNRDTASGIAPSMSEFKAQRDVLVNDAMQQLQEKLTPYGFSRLLMYVQNQKQFMQTWEGQ